MTAPVLLPAAGRPGRPPGAAATGGVEVPLLPVQRRFLESSPVDVHDFVLTFLVRVDVPVDRAACLAAVETLLAAHESLRMDFHAVDGTWTARLHEPVADAARTAVGPVRSVPDPAATHLDPLVAEVVATQRDRLRIDRWPLLAMDVLRHADGTVRLVLSVHHLVCDAYSAGILLRDAAAALSGRGAQPPPVGAARWADRLRAYATGPAAAGELAFWLGLSWGGVGTGGTGGPAAPGPADPGGWEWVQAEPVPPAGADGALLLAAAARAYGRLTGDPAVLVDTVDLGRPSAVAGASLLRTVGWLTSVYPAVVDLRGLPPAAELASGLRRAPHQGVGWGALRTLGPPAVRSALAGLPAAAFYLNYQGGYGGPGRRAAPPLQLERYFSSLSARTEAYAAKLYPRVVGQALVLGLRYRPDRLPDGLAAAWVQEWAGEVGAAVTAR